jgi:hypothetical protein
VSSTCGTKLRELPFYAGDYAIDALGSTAISAPFLAFVLLHPCLHQSLDKRSRQPFVRRELNGPFGYYEAFQFLFKRFDNRGRGEQTAMFRKRGIPYQHSFVLERGNSILMISAASAGTADRIAARICFNAPWAGAGTLARYSSKFFGVPFFFAAALRLPDFTFLFLAPGLAIIGGNPHFAG